MLTLLLNIICTTRILITHPAGMPAPLSPPHVALSRAHPMGELVYPVPIVCSMNTRPPDLRRNWLRGKRPSRYSSLVISESPPSHSTSNNLLESLQYAKSAPGNNKALALVKVVD